MPRIKPDRIADQVYAASKAAFSELIRANANQCFYAFALFTDDSLQFLHAVANTEEALTSTVKRYRETVDPKYGCTSTRAGMRWSYGDWGFSRKSVRNILRRLTKLFAQTSIAMRKNSGPESNCFGPQS